MSRKPLRGKLVDVPPCFGRLGRLRQWVGEIEAVEEREAIKIAAKEFKQPAKKLMAVPRR